MQCVVVAALLGPPSPPPHGIPPPPVVPCGVGSPLPLPPMVAVGCTPLLHSPDSDEYYGDDDDEDGVMIPIRTLLRSLAQESRMKIIQTRAQAYLNEPNRNLAWNDTGPYSFRVSQARF